MLGNILYLHVLDLKQSLAIKQTIDKVRFVKVIEETPVTGGKKGEQYMTYKVQSIFDPSTIYTINNYLSPYNFCSIENLENIVLELQEILLPEKLEDINYIIKGVKESTKKA